MTMSLKLIFWICFTAAMIVYVTMLTWTIPAIKEAAGGIAPFDMRPMGYDASDAQAFLQALTPDGRQLYLGVQSQLDTFYPALMAISLGLGMYLLSPVRWKLGRWIGAAFATAGAALDYLENHLVLEMLHWNTEVHAPELVQAASRVTVLKSICTTMAMTCFLAVLAGWLYGRWKVLGAEKQG